MIQSCQETSVCQYQWAEPGKVCFLPTFHSSCGFTALCVFVDLGFEEEEEPVLAASEPRAGGHCGTATQQP